MNNLQRFIETYNKCLRAAIDADPNPYLWDLEHFDEFIQRMERAINNRSFNKDSPTFRQTCKTLGIRHTYRAIDTFLKEA